MPQALIHNFYNIEGGLVEKACWENTNAPCNVLIVFIVNKLFIHRMSHTYMPHVLYLAIARDQKKDAIALPLALVVQ